MAGTVAPERSVRDHESVADIERVERSDVAEAPLPRTRFEIGLELRNPSSNDVWVEKREARHSRSYLRIEVRLWSTPEGSEESIATIVRYGDPIDSAVPEVVLDFGSGRTPASIERDDLRKIHLGEPEIAKFGRLDGQDHEAIRHSLHFVETAAPIGPVVQREHRERGIKCLRSEGESLSRRLDYKRCLTRSLPDHVPRWFNGYQEPADRFVGASASSDVDHGVGIAECIQNRGADPGIRMPCRCGTSVQSGRTPRESSHESLSAHVASDAAA